MRVFGGHTARVTGSREYAARGMEIKTIRIMARHSGDHFLRYVQDAPLRSLRADLGLTASTNPTASALTSVQLQRANPRHECGMGCDSCRPKQSDLRWHSRHRPGGHWHSYGDARTDSECSFITSGKRRGNTRWLMTQLHKLRVGNCCCQQTGRSSFSRGAVLGQQSGVRDVQHCLPTDRAIATISGNNDHDLSGDE